MSSADTRTSRLISHLTPTLTSSPLLSSHPTALTTKKADDVVIISALRTPIGRAKKGIFKDTFVEDLLAAVIKGTIDRTKIDPAVIGDIVVGTVLGPGSQRANECRIGAFLAGVPDNVPLHTINRQCSSGLQAVAHVAANIKAGNYDIGLACGVESMSTGKFLWEGSMNPKVFLNQQAKACLLPMGITSENVAAKWNISRKEQDELAVLSHKKAAAAIASGRFKDEIVPVVTKIKDANGAEKEIIADTDDGVRVDTTVEGLGKLNAVFQKGGSTTAGNASQVSDGAGAVLVSSRAYAEKAGLPIIAKFISFAAVGVPPEVMGIGPAYAIPAALKKAGLSINDIDIFEINEAFASQAMMTIKQLKIPIEKVNPNGGAIALGHPLGATGARMTATLLSELRKRKARYGVVAMCIGSGMGAAAVYELE